MQNTTQVVDLKDYRAVEEDRPLADASPQHLPAGTTLLLGQYKIIGYLNCGGFGITYRARDSLKREVVIKECFPSEMAFRKGKSMRPRSSSYTDELNTIVQSFVQEAHRLDSARHPNIVPVHQIFEENDTAYIAMDYVDGLDLQDIMDHDPSLLGPSEVETIVRTMLEAIDFVHASGLLHRDISPDNILIDTKGEPVLIDFGSAHESVSKSGFSRMKFVKDGYSPQEFYIAGSEQGPWSDLYSFAASIYHVITGAPPEMAQKRLSALAARQPDPYEPLVGKVSEYPEPFLEAIDMALKTLPADRLQSAHAWMEQLAAPPRSRVTSEPLILTPDVLAPANATPKHLAAEKMRALGAQMRRLSGRAAVTAKVAGSVAARKAKDGIQNLPVHPGLAAGVAGIAIMSGVGLLTLSSAPVRQAPETVASVQAPIAPPAPVLASTRQVSPNVDVSSDLSTPVALRQPSVPSELPPMGRVKDVMPLSDVARVAAPSVSVQSPGAFGSGMAVSDAPELGALRTPLAKVTPTNTLQAALPNEMEPDAVVSDMPDIAPLQMLDVDLAEMDVGLSGFIFAPNGEALELSVVTPGGVIRSIAPQRLPSYWLDAPPVD